MAIKTVYISCIVVQNVVDLLADTWMQVYDWCRLWLSLVVFDQVRDTAVCTVIVVIFEHELKLVHCWSYFS